MLKLGKCLDGEEESDKVIPWTALASSQSKKHNGKKKEKKHGSTPGIKSD